MKNTTTKPPIAKSIPKVMEIHGEKRVDNYYWMRLTEEQKNAGEPDEHTREVFDYLNAENEYYKEVTEDTELLKAQLFEEMKGRIKEDDSSVPFKDNGYYYITRYEKGQQYPIHTRKKGDLEAPEEIVFDVNEMAKGSEYYSLNGVDVSEDNLWVSFGVDNVSRRQYLLQFKNLETGALSPEKIENTTGNATWANDHKTIFYAKKDPLTLRSDRIFRHELGTDPANDVEVYYEADDTFSTFVYKTKSKQYIVIGSSSTLTTEYRVLHTENPFGEFSIIQERTRGLEYSISHFEDYFYIFTNKDKAVNFKVMRTPIAQTGVDNWEDVIPHRADVFLENFSIFKEYLVLEERAEGLNKIRVIRWDETADYYIPFEEETYAAGVFSNPEFDTDIIRYGYNSMTTPASVIDFNMKDHSAEILKEQEVLGGKFKKENYRSQRTWIEARDGKKVAVSMVYHKDTQLNQDTPLLLYAYGSYGHTISDSFSTTRLSLLDRGFVFAIAHIRGSQYLGREWYDDGKLLRKMNTFTDFIDCSKGLIELGYTSSKHLYAMGGSAGGLLMGVVINLNPELYNGVIASVPFVDVMTTMLDETIPLTTFEYDEWGNPNDKTFYEYMRAYSPYDNIANIDYPNMLVITGLHDSQVQYYEPAKWVAKLRTYNTSANILIFDINMEAGHGGASGRFNALKETAKEYAFLLDLEGIKA